ncbi:zinc finger protein 830 [Diachasma alloeum]|uniref:zinc finger protein 830 n=1 Tax=Diachasma alloeum TaxID=454923 RepID=UPI0007384300|nr:zinc finger protein 830 [Diachasma alloeum]
MSGAKKISQHDLRKAMMDHKKKAGAVRKIESPLAKYTETGQLMCLICKSIIRSETVWPVHLNSKSHRENVSSAKKILETKEVPSNPPKGDRTFKRPSSPDRESDPPKKVKGILKSFETSSALPPDFFDNPNGVTKATVVSVTKQTEELVIKASRSVGSARGSDEPKEVKEPETSNSAALPEGFFDDPILDAKVRNVEYKDPIEEEWDKFQKEMREEAAQSAQIIAEDQEEATTERQLDEIEEQIRNWSRVMDLVRRKEQVQAAEKKKESVDEDMSSGDESDYDEFLDWRAKTSYK